MKKHLILFAFIGLALFSCKKEKNPSLVGNWYGENPVSADSVQVIAYMEFGSNGHFNEEVRVYKRDTHELLGFSEKASGTYVVDGRSLTQYVEEQYLPDSAQLYVSENELVPREPVMNEKQAAFVLNDNQSKLQLYFSCPPNASCYDQPFEYQRGQ